MSRLIFEARRRLPSPVTRKGSISIEAPPELPRVIPPSLLKRALPVVIVLLIVGMIVAMVATGMRLISPQTLFFPFVLLLAATAFFRGGDNKSRTEEVDAERADYLRYLSVVRDNIRGQAAAQRAAAEWSHPEPADLAAIPGSRRQWERDPAGRRLPGGTCRCALGGIGHRAAGQRHRRRGRPGAGVAQRITQSVGHSAHSSRRADRSRPGQAFARSPCSATPMRCALRCGPGWLRR